MTVGNLNKKDGRMKMHQRILIVAVTLVLCVAFAAPAIYESLPAAVAEGRIYARISGNGGSSGDALKIEVSRGPNAGSEPVRVSVPPGLRAGASNASMQGMVIARVVGRMVDDYRYTPASEIVVDTEPPAVIPVAPVVYLLEAYCADFEKENPSASTTFSIQHVDSALKCILEQAHSDSLNTAATQAAVWMETDNITYQHVNEKFRVTSSEWNAARNVYQRCQGSVN